jgi:hypothetical protein
MRRAQSIVSELKERPLSSDVLRQFFTQATQYYVAGRYAALAGLSPVAGNLIHHAIEMYLKGTLAKTLTLGELKKLKHNLPKVWEAFKVQAPDPALAAFDSLVSSLDAFEEIRYPDLIVARGMAATVGVSRGAVARSAATPSRSEPTYEVYIEETDELVGKVFEVAAVNPAFFLNGLSKRSREYLTESNTQSWAG